MINACVVGLGHRGYMLVQTVLVNNDDVNIVAVCDLYEDRREKNKKMVEEKTGKTPILYENYKDLIANPDIEAVFIISLPRFSP